MKKTVLITGASRGIGAAMARLFAEKGWNTALNYNSSGDAATALAQELGENCAVFKADVSNQKQVDEMVSSVLARFGGIDCLINNAGISLQALVTDTSSEQWNKLFAVNSTGTFLCSQAVLRHMIPRKGGSILNISSMWGQVGASCEVAYSASKAAVIGFTKALAKEVGPSGIRVNCIAPGVIDTDMNLNLSPQDMDALVEETPLCRIGSGSDIARLALFLAEEDSFITGQIIGSNGGFVI